MLLTSAPDEKEAINALKAGVRGYCQRDIDPPLLAKALNVIRKGEIWVGRKVIPHLLEELTKVTELHHKDSPQVQDFRFDCLTGRERQIGRLIGDGSCNKEIAAQLHISERTVKAHLTSIFRKLRISDRVRLALLMTEHGRGSD